MSDLQSDLNLYYLQKPEKPANFIVLGTPRSGTFALSKLLSRPGQEVLHEPCRFWKGWEDFNSAFDCKTAICDSLLTFRWKEIVSLDPMIKIVMVHRHEEDVKASFEKLGLWSEFLEEGLRKIDEVMSQMVSYHEVYCIPFTKLFSLRTLWKLHEYIEIPWDNKLIYKVRSERPQADIKQTFQDAQNNAKGLRILFPELFPHPF